MPAEVLRYLQPQPGGTYLDGTLGGAGHARLILEASGETGRLIGLDRDPDALQHAQRILSTFGDRAILRQGNFSNAGEILATLGISGVDGILLDLGVSSYQLDEGGRGFSFRVDAPLDMRMGPDARSTAAAVVNNAEAADLARIFRDYGEERWAKRIARRIVEARSRTPIETTRELAALVKAAIPAARQPPKIHPATRVFQALRIYVNEELDHVARGVADGIDLLKPGARMVVISFHSLEDRIVKRFFQQEARGCVCPPKLPMCACGRSPRVEILARKAVKATAEEITANPRARSAVLRAVRRCP